MTLLRRLRRLFACLLLIGIVTSIAWSFAADNIVDASHAGDMVVDVTPAATPTPTPTATPAPTPTPIPPGDIPLVCTLMNLTNEIVITGSGAIQGTAANDLILGSPDKDVIHAGAGNDCIVGNGGADQFFGDDGFDICIGNGNPKEKFHDCEIEIW